MNLGTQLKGTVQRDGSSQNQVPYKQLLAMAQWTNLEYLFLWRSELIKARMLFFSVVNSAMNAQRHWELRDSIWLGFSNYKWAGSSTNRTGKLSSAFEKAYTIVLPIPMAQWISFPCWQFISELPTAVQGGAESLKGSHRMGDRRIILKIIRTSHFNKGLLNEPNFGRIYLAGQ